MPTSHGTPSCGDFGGKKRGGDKGPCTQSAGWGTAHAGEGKCKLHGGSSTGRPITHGRYSLKHRQALQDKVDKFLNDERPADLRGELALMRALLQDYLDRFGDPMPMPYDDIERVYSMTESISRTVERISRILAQTAFTAAELQFLEKRISDLTMKYIDEPNKRLQFVEELFSPVETPRLYAADVIDAAVGAGVEAESELA